jgi:hypothetical protein
VEEKTGKKPIIYTAAFMSSAIGTEFEGYTLWVANYEATCPLLPANFKAWKFWQFSHSGRVPGIGGDVDEDHFNGTLDELVRFAIEAGSTQEGGVGSGPEADAALPPPPPDAGNAGQTAGSTPPPSDPAPPRTPPGPCER